MEGHASVGLVSAFLGGLLTSLTPCVYPLIPITVSIFGAKQSRRREAALLSATYVLGIAVTYTALGVVAAATGAIFGQFLGNPWVVGAIALMLAGFGLGMLGAYDLTLPASVQTRLSQLGGRGFGGALVMGLVAGVLAAPCTGPVLGGILTYAATTGNPWQGAGLLFVYALGLGLPFFLLGTFTLSLPKAGRWMEIAKAVLGLVMLIAAVYFVLPILLSLRLGAALAGSPGALVTARWVAAGVALVGLALGAVHRSFGAALVGRLRKVAAIFLVVSGVSFALWGGMVGRPALPATTYTSAEWLAHESGVLAAAKSEGKPVIVDFGAEWCAACRELEDKSYPHACVADALSRFVFVKVDQTKPTPADDALAERYGITGLPYVQLFDTKGTWRKDASFFGYKEPDALCDVLKGLP